jgi:predicted dehydrogenase
LLLLFERIRAPRDELEVSLGAFCHRRPSAAVNTALTTADEERDDTDEDDDDVDDDDDCVVLTTPGYNHIETSASSTAFPP